MTLKPLTLTVGTLFILALSGQGWTADVKSMAADAVKDQAVEAAKGQATDAVKGKAGATLPTTSAVPAAAVQTPSVTDPTKSVKETVGGKAESATGAVSGGAAAKKATGGVTGTATEMVKDQATDMAKDQATKAVKDKAATTEKDVVK